MGLFSRKPKRKKAKFQRIAPSGTFWVTSDNPNWELYHTSPSYKKIKEVTEE